MADAARAVNPYFRFYRIDGEFDIPTEVEGTRPTPAAGLQGRRDRPIG